MRENAEADEWSFWELLLKVFQSKLPNLQKWYERSPFP